MAARKPDSAALAALRDALQRCRECPLGYRATQAVAGEGALRPALMLVGEVPGDREDLQGHPFVGPAGQLLFRAVDSLGWPREALFVTNAVKHFKFELRGKRRIHKTPSQREAAACLHWLEDEIAQVEPRAAVALGATAARSLMRRTVAVTRERGQWLRRGDDLPVLVTLHPSALLRTRGEEREVAYRQWLADLHRADEVVAAWSRPGAAPASPDSGRSRIARLFPVCHIGAASCAVRPGEPAPESGTKSRRSQ